MVSKPDLDTGKILRLMRRSHWTIWSKQYYFMRISIKMWNSEKTSVPFKVSSTPSFLVLIRC
jgi:hypothetical protein